MLLEIENLVKQYKNGPRANDCISLSYPIDNVIMLQTNNEDVGTIRRLIRVKAAKAGTRVSLEIV